MALFVVACGLLLMLGGAVSLLLGFDIVLTERGSAMTIGGVVALSGGVIAVGVGMALRRLNQILAVLDARTGRPVRSVSSDRPVLPFGGEQTALPAAGTSDRFETTPPVRGTSDTVTAAGAMLPGMATAGIAAGAAVIGAATVFGRTRGQDADPQPDEAGVLTVEDQSWVDDRNDSSGEPSADREVWSAQPAAPPPLPLPQDLEEELSRALAETTVLPEAEKTGDRSFEDGLSALLDAPVPSAEASPEPVYPQDPGHGDDLADQLGQGDIAGRQSGLDGVGARWPDQFDESSATAPIVPEDREANPVEDIAAEERPFDLVEAAEDGGPEVEEPPTAPLRQRDDDIFADLHLNREEPGVAVAAAAPETPVLGTYAIGGRTYRMFADGAVEAVSEHGEIERFASMDALRKHLAGA